MVVVPGVLGDGDCVVPADGDTVVVVVAGADGLIER